MSYPGTREEAKSDCKAASMEPADWDTTSPIHMGSEDGGGGLKGGGNTEDLKKQHWSFTDQKKRRSYGVDS